LHLNGFTDAPFESVVPLLIRAEPDVHHNELDEQAALFLISSAVSKGNGENVLTVSSGDAGITDIAEAETYTMMLAGPGLVPK